MNSVLLMRNTNNGVGVLLFCGTPTMAKKETDSIAAGFLFIHSVIGKKFFIP